ncbi:hypothetical protein CC1G_04868 [Coprinopsis cinerea okayama7|uniref:Uncharacterized protein n=1 Tax=Coprinopsis cinerea (strain Okayama-7 / 130 / ATCC MYA-4618 / FGSC 9003) TaxID=240176 RepID=A8PFV5_COPC7|nr:hypothetical protein CC1G_04868 [Coprinopsis cinerea okayama7\|eukprot:XP_001841024.2 hypothetical protein CC1G_04868 [Coprinopsis cinerea okayama7\
MAERAGSLYYSSAFDAQVTKVSLYCALQLDDTNFGELTLVNDVSVLWRSSICGKAPAGTSLESSSSFRDTSQSHKSHSSFVVRVVFSLLMIADGWLISARLWPYLRHGGNLVFAPALQAKACYGMHVAVLVILLLCLYALYGSKRRHAPAFWGSYFVYMGVQLATLVVYIVHTRLPPLAVRGTNCYTTNTSFGDRFMMANRILRLSLHVVMFLLAAWKGARRYRRLKSPLIKTVLGGEMAYYGGVFALDVVARYYSPNDPARLKILT